MVNYVIYKGSEGLTHMLGGIAYCIDWCILNDHKLLIDCLCNPYLNINFSDFFFLKDFEYIDDYDKLENITESKKLKIKNGIPKLHDLICNVYKMDNIIISKSLYKWDNNCNFKIYCGDGGNNRTKINKYIRIKNQIKNEIFKFDLHKKYQKYIGIHFRNTDKNNNIYNYLDRLKNNNIIYIATDNTISLNQFKDYFPKKKIISFSINNFTNNPLHYDFEEKNKLIINTLTDIYILSNCDEFYGSPNSLITRLVHYIRENKNKNIFI